MCGRYTLAGTDISSLRDRFGIGDSVEIRRRYNVAPTDDVLAVTTDREGAPRGDILKWGLVPFWSKEPKSGFKMINARSETIGEKAAFRDLLDRRRCLIIADGFYEWQAVPGAKRKQPLWITRPDHEPFAFAGLWTTWHGDSEDDVLRTCTILTTAANDAIAPVHDRMPVILRDRAGEQLWLDHGASFAEARELLVPLPDDELELRPVGLAVNDARHDEPDCLDPPPAGDGEPGTLF